MYNNIIYGFNIEYQALSYLESITTLLYICNDFDYIFNRYKINTTEDSEGFIEDIIVDLKYLNKLFKYQENMAIKCIFDMSNQSILSGNLLTYKIYYDLPYNNRGRYLFCLYKDKIFSRNNQEKNKLIKFSKFGLCSNSNNNLVDKLYGTIMGNTVYKEEISNLY